MRQYAVRRLLLSVVVIWIVVTFVFFATRVLPGDYAAQLVAQNFLGGSGQSSESMDVALKDARHRLGTDKPVAAQYVIFIKNVASGDFGRSFRYHTPAFETVQKALPYSIQLGAMTMAIALLLGVPIGVISAIRKGSVWDNGLRLFATGGIAAPSFFTATLGTLLVLRFSLFPIDIIKHPGIWEDSVRSLELFAVPALAGGFATAAVVMRFVRSQLLEVLRQDYVRTAHAKGLSERTVILRHALKNALVPIVTVFGFIFTTLVSGSIILEQMFNIPGMGQNLVAAITTRDLPVTQALAFVIAVFVVGVNLLIDLSYPLLDPRIKQ